MTKSAFTASPARRAAGIVLLVALAACEHGCSASHAPGSRKGGAPITVGTAQAQRADIPVTLNAIGTVQPVTVATVRTQLAGTLFGIDFTEGQLVAKGQLLGQIDPRPYRLALSQAQANLSRDEAQLNLARLDLTRYQTLLSQDSIARQQVETQTATVRQYQGTVAADRAAIGTAQLNLSYTSIRAPVAGRIGLRQADIGNYLTPGDATGIAVITQIDPIDIAFALPQAQMAAIQARAGADIPVTATDQAGTTVLASGHFLTLDNQVDPTSGTVKAKARFPNSGNKLFPSQFVNVSLLVDVLRQAVTVPVSAVRHGASGDFVFRLQPDQTARLTPVQTGPSSQTSIAILRGLAAGATVITEGADALDDGSHVTLPSASGSATGRPHGGHRKHNAGDGQ